MSCSVSKKKNEFTVVVDSLLNEKHFIMQAESCTVSLTRYDSELNHGIIKYRNPCNFDPNRDSPKFEVLLRAVLKDKLTDSLRTLSWGRLTPAIRKSSILGRRLAIAASRSEIWDKRLGKSSAFGENNFVRDLINTQNIFKELKDVFQKCGMEIKIVSVEKVLVFRAEELPDFDLYQQYGIAKQDRIPIDCQIWIGVKD